MSHRIDWVRRAVCVSLVLLVAATWRLWFSPEPFPQIPLLRLAVDLPPTIDPIAAAVMLIAAAAAAAVRSIRLQTIALSTAAFSLVLLFVGDQHRLQPWAYQIFWMLIAIACCRAAVALRMIRILVVSIYLFSGISKLDYQFVYTIGRDFLGGLVGMTGQSIEGWPETLLVAATLSFPIGEIAIAVALVFARTRGAAVLAAIAMHLILFVLLGPLGLNHQPGVLIWNLVSATMVGLLFWKVSGGAGVDATQADKESEVPRAESQSHLSRPHLQPLAVVMLAAVSAAPLLEPFGFYDHWLAWGLYAPHNSRVRLLIDERSIERLPASLQRHAVPIAAGSSTRQVNLDRWSIDCLSVPIYPQSRFQAGVALAVLQQSQLASGFRLELQSASNRRDGQRTIQEIGNQDQLKLHLNRYTFNALPRR
ncbi:hypothetical protein EC9_30640 [Rosistilla ulvae]|uniref:Uncharacterized protein n=1 Tax=Rosistilla ulvae TaxID=1930277 RepID=A0A517M208_9BACT|nr:hypothetical protein [Rosistilla ulvae]QDS88869.1 hypothetical protein EC9_30640 [Rosistilla ulvae]